MNKPAQQNPGVQIPATPNTVAPPVKTAQQQDEKELNERTVRAGEEALKHHAPAGLPSE